ncbi:MAG: prephenate dehydratase [Lentisphaerales bacterium]|nr:prephenate dehydratase [Lentisphaerales bacterium]
MDLSELRVQIDAIDEQIVTLINKRYGLVHEVGKWKNSNSHEIYVPEREKALLERLGKLNKGPLPNITLRAIYREIMSGALALEYPLAIAYLGPENTFTYQAAVSKFGKSVKYTPKNSIAEVFEDVEKGVVPYGVVPIENSTEGAVTYTLDMFANSNCSICAEINLPIHHFLMSQGTAEDIEVIYSHPQGIAQCRAFLHKNYPLIRLVEVRSTAEAAKRAASEEGAAAIASEMAAETYQLNVLDKNIEDRSNNNTRFFIISKQQPKVTGDDKTSLMFIVKDKVGALYECLSYFDKEAISLTMIESRPSKNKEGEYLFFVDFHGHSKDEVTEKVLGDLKESCIFVKILGSYPSGKFKE